MKQNIIHIGLDVDDTQYHGSAFNKETGEVVDFQCRPTLKGLLQQLDRMARHFPGRTIRLCYEASYLGYCLQRDLMFHDIHCDVVSPSSIPSPRGKTIKTDRIDAGYLAQFGDLLAGSNNTHIATLVERHTRYVMLAKVANKDTATVVNALIKQSKKLPRELYKSLTWDRGKELSDHKLFSLATDIKVYFCDPQSPWQRGSNENTNGLLRQYFPKGTNLSGHSQAKLNAVARQLNGRPRKTLDFETPAERFNQCVALIG